MNYLGRASVSRQEVRTQCKKPVGEAVLELMDAGWTVVPASHKFRLICPCRPDYVSFRVDGTPRNPGVLADQVRKKAEKCPDRHELVK